MRRRRSVQLFSFSFVDILATNIGVLLFILLMAVINESGFAAYRQWTQAVKDAEAELAAMAPRISEAKARYQQAHAETIQEMTKPIRGRGEIAQQVRYLTESNSKLNAKNQQTRQSIGSLEKEKENIADTAARIKSARPPDQKGYMFPKAREKTGAVAIHVDCRSDGLVVMGADVTVGVENRETCPTSRIASPGSPFMRLIDRLKRLRGKEVIVLWVRPDGIDAADKAIKAARNATVALGWEPANKDWSF